MLIKTQKIGTRKNGNSEKTHCKNGHLYTEETTYISPKSQKRSCKICTSARVSFRWRTEPELKVKQREHMREWRAKNIQRDRKNWTDLRKKKYEWVATQKTACYVCGEQDPICLDFHHKDPKQKTIEISLAIARWSIKRIQEEINKCDVICANCHRKLHATERTESLN